MSGDREDGAMIQVTKEKFFAVIGPRDVHPWISNNRYPYTKDWFLQPGRSLIGKSVGRTERGEHFTDYFLTKAWAGR
jgi:hypothetical protein